MDAFKNKVLVVEDSPTTQKLIGMHLKKSQYVQPVFADDYKSAQNILSQQESQNILCAVLDLNLSDAPNGEIVDLVQEYGLPIIVLTGQKSKAIQKTMEAKNIIDYVVKKHYRELDYISEKIDSLYLNQKVSVLVVDDSNESQSIIKSYLDNLCFNTVLSTSSEEALSQIDNDTSIGLAILDYSEGGVDGIELTEIIREERLKEDLPIIGISGKNKDEIGAKFLKLGANDYMHKPLFSSEFYCRVQHNIDMLRNISIIKKASKTDFLTKINNRREFFTVGEKQYKRSKKNAHMMFLAMIDADHFKAVNDTYGHDAGDAVLVELAKTLTSVMPEALVARFGGEEFTCLATIKDEAEGRDLLEKLRKSVENLTVRHDGIDIKITISVGVSTIYGDSFYEMLKLADEAVFDAKDQGRNQVIFASDQ